MLVAKTSQILKYRAIGKSPIKSSFNQNNATIKLQLRAVSISPLFIVPQSRKIYSKISKIARGVLQKNILFLQKLAPLSKMFFQYLF